MCPVQPSGLTDERQQMHINIQCRPAKIDPADLQASEEDLKTRIAGKVVQQGGEDRDVQEFTVVGVPGSEPFEGTWPAGTEVAITITDAYNFELYDNTSRVEEGLKRTLEMLYGTLVFNIKLELKEPS